MTPFVVGLLLLLGGPTSWPEYRGVAADGDAGAADLPLEWSEGHHVTFKTAIHGRGWSTPVADAGRIWLTTATDDGHELSVLCVDAATGEILHDRKIFEVAEPDPINSLNSYASPSPVIDGDRVFVHFGTYGTACLDARSAEVLWTREDLHCDHLEGPGSSLFSFEDLLIFHMDGADRQSIHALAQQSGETVWTTDRSRPLDGYPPDLRKAYSTPVVVSVGDRIELVSSSAQHTFGYDPRTGGERWHAALEGFSMAARPALGHGMVFLNTGFMKPRLVALRLGGEGEITSDIAWETTRGIPTMSSTLVVGDELFVVSDAGVASCLDAQSGSEHWRERLDGEYCASPLHASGRVYFCNRDGLTSIVRASTRFEVLGRNRLDAGCMASPIALGDALFLRTITHLYRLEVTPRGVSSEHPPGR